MSTVPTHAPVTAPTAPPTTTPDLPALVRVALDLLVDNASARDEVRAAETACDRARDRSDIATMMALAYRPAAHDRDTFAADRVAHQRWQVADERFMATRRAYLAAFEAVHNAISEDPS